MNTKTILTAIFQVTLVVVSWLDTLVSQPPVTLMLNIIMGQAKTIPIRVDPGTSRVSGHAH